MTIGRRAAALLALSAILQLGVALLPDTMGDLLDYRIWMRTLAHQGLEAAYWPPPSPRIQTPVDYPPVFPYTLLVLGRGLAAVSPTALANDRVLDFVIRLPLCLALLSLALLVHFEAKRTEPAFADAALALVALNPALLFDTAYWGQADALCGVFMVASLVAVVRGRPAWAGVAVAAAVLTKPLALPLVPLLLFETWRRAGPRGAARCAAAGVALTLLAFAPFWWIGRGLDVAQALVFQLEAMPYVSVNAHNLWWLLTGGVPWTPADARPLGALTCRAWSLVFFAAFYAAVVGRLRRSAEPRALYVAAASTLLGFFVLSTHMHENHLFFAVVLLALAATADRVVRPFAWLASGVLLVNMLLHDPFLTHLARPVVPGPHLLLPQQLGIGKGLLDYLVGQGYPWAAEEIRGETSLLGLVGTLLNAQAAVLLLAAWWQATSGRGAVRTRRWAPAAAAFVTVSGVLFLDHVRRYPREHLFLLRFAQAETQAPFADGVGLTYFDVGGESRPTLYAHPPAEIRYRLVVPPRSRLRFGVALKPEVWSKDKGDGVEFIVRVQDAGETRTLVSRYVDPKSRAEDRRWQEVEVDLSELAGHDVTLAFVTTGGPAGNTDFDWAGFGDPTLTSR